MSNHKIAYLSLDDIAPADVNPKKHDIDALMRSIAQFGFVAPALRDETTSKLVAGHGRLEALRRMRDEGHEAPKGIKTRNGGEWLVPVVTGISLTEEQAKAYILADNRLSEIGGWDYKELNDLLGDLKSASFDLTDIGYTAGDLKAIEVEALVGEVPRYTDNDPVPADVTPGALVDEGPATPTEAAAAKGPSPAMAAEVNSQIRRVQLYVTTEQYNRIVDLMSKAMVATGCKNHSEVVLKLLEDTYGAS